ncbi:hypothetical protein NW762_007829 [Fusarium torreyae]|uniref:SMP-30/Gluconolactonase/LRE-like region domain-containing protein n=1 Tax=Fusarium torreyae TaxID=1237075 RepID=A0A9W8RZM2_9HYPO|nr:hypothetical protein NW762_007829 [Fusarium torreyae]
MKLLTIITPLILYLAPIWGCQAEREPGGVSTVFQLDNIGTWFENLALRSDGDIIATRMDVPELWLIDPVAKEGRSLVTIPGVTGAIGITQLTYDTYVVGAGNVTANPFNFEAGSMQVFLLEFKRGFPCLKLITTLPDAMFINGITPWSSTEVLVSDTVLGAVYQIDVSTGSVRNEVSHDDFSGINGIGVQDGFLYYISNNNQTFFRVSISTDLNITGSPEAIFSGMSMDDLSLARDGTAYIAAIAMGQIIRVDPDGSTTAIAGAADSMEAMGCTAVRLARSKGFDRILYATTNGGLGAPLNGSVPEPAKIIAVKL